MAEQFYQKPRRYLFPIKITLVSLFLTGLSFTFLPLEASAQDITTGLVGHWKFDEGSGTNAADSSGNGNTGTLTNGPTWAVGKNGTGIQFDGVDDQVNVGNPASLNLASSFTLSAWMYPDGLSGDRDIITKVGGAGADYYLQTTNNQLQVGFAAAGNWYSHITTNASLPFNTWTHVSGVFDDAANILTIYVNGVQLGSQTVAASRTSSSDPVHIGMGWSNQSWNGRIDDARIYNRALSQSDIQTVMNAGGGDTPLPTDTIAPSNPTNLSAIAQSSSQINLSWSASTDNIGVTGYRVERCQGSTCTTFTQISTPTGTSYNDTGLTANTIYRYRVRAADAAGNLSGYSNIANATTQTAPTGGGYTRIFYDGSESGNTNLWGQDDIRNKCLSVTTGLDGATPYAESRMISCNDNGALAWNDQAAFETLTIPMSNYSNELFIRTRFRLDTDHDVTPTPGKKFMRMFYWDGNQSTYKDSISVIENGGVIYHCNSASSVCAPYWGGAAGDNVGSRGAWHQLEYYFNSATGRIKVWHDDILVTDQIVSVTSNKWTPFYITSNWSAAHDAANHIYFDEFEVYTDSTSGTVAMGSLSDGSITAGSPPTTLVGDLNNDRTVNGLDWAIMASVWFTNDATADLNKDGVVNSIDFSLMNQNWGRSI